MKIAYLTPEYPHPRTGKAGGIGTSIFNLSKALLPMGHSVSILVYGQDKDEHFEDNGISFLKIKNIKVKGLSFFLTQKKIERLINKMYEEQKVDIVEAPDWTGFSAFINPKCPLVLRLNGSDTYFCHLDKRQVKFKNQFLEKRALKNAKGIISVSAFTGKLTNTLFKLNRDFTVIPNGIDVTAFSPEHNTGNTLSILYFGTLIRKKGLLELASIFNLVHDKNNEVELVLVGKDSPDISTGSSSTWELMKPLFSESALKKVNYTGPVPYAEMREKIETATLCVFPTFAEALPVSWLEAMALEKPVVASNVGWASEVIDDGKDGFLVNPKAHKDYSERIIKLLGDAILAQEFAKAAREKILKHFSSEIVAKKSVSFYKKYLN